MSTEMLNVIAAIGAFVGGLVVALWQWKRQIDAGQRRVENTIQSTIHRTLETFVTLNTDLRNTLGFYQSENMQLHALTEKLSTELIQTNRDRLRQDERIRQLEREIVELREEIERLTAELHSRAA